MIPAALAAGLPVTGTLRAILAQPISRSALEDLLFLEAWERNPAPGLAAVHRARQIRRANPEVAAAIRSEIAAR